MTLPTAHERKALRNLYHQKWEFETSLGVGDKTRASLLEKGWMEPFPDTPSGRARYSITDAGKAALDQPTPKPQRKSPRLKTMAPRVKPLK